jgi:hypothetical protein
MAQSHKAEVRNGRLVLDEPTDLPNGTVVELVEADAYAHLDGEDPFAGVPPEELDKLDASIDQSLAEVKRGESHSVEEFLDEL